MTKNESDKVEVQRCEGSSKQGWKSKSQIRHKIIYSIWYTHTVYFYLTFFIADKFSKKWAWKFKEPFPE